MTGAVMNVDFQKINSNLPSSLEIVIEKSPRNFKVKL